MFTCQQDYEDYLTERRTMESLNCMIAPSVQDAAEIARIERLK